MRCALGRIIAQPSAKEKVQSRSLACGQLRRLTIVLDYGIIGSHRLHQFPIPFQPMPITLADIAARADVSLSTVSRVLNNKEHVSISTRNAVLEAVTALGYSRQDSRREENIDTVLLLVHESNLSRINDSAMAQDMERLIVAGAQDTLRAVGVFTQLAHQQLGHTKTFDLPRVSNLAGVINIGSIFNPILLRKLLSDGVRVVCAGSQDPTLPLDSVTLDFQDAYLQIVRHLVDRGHRTIGLMNAPDTVASSTTRYMAYRLALALHDLPYAPEQTTSGAFTFLAGDEMTRALIAGCPGIDAIIYGDDDMAVGGMRALRSMGRRVPDDIAVVGMFNYDIGTFTDPPLTTVNIDKYEIGRVAAQRLLMRMEGIEGPPWSLTLPVQLVVRNSA